MCAPFLARFMREKWGFSYQPISTFESLIGT